MRRAGDRQARSSEVDGVKDVECFSAKIDADTFPRQREGLADRQIGIEDGQAAEDAAGADDTGIGSDEAVHGAGVREQTRDSVVIEGEAVGGDGSDSRCQDAKGRIVIVDVIDTAAGDVKRGAGAERDQGGGLPAADNLIQPAGRVAEQELTFANGDVDDGVGGNGVAAVKVGGP